MKHYARFFGIIGIIFIVFGGVGSIALSGAGRSVGVLQFLVGFIGLIIFLFYFLRETISKISEKREIIFGAFGGLFLLLLLIGANVVAHSKFGERKFDLTTNKIHSLSPQTVQMIKNLKSPIEIFAFFEKGNRELELLQDLADKYTYENQKISLQIIDPDKNPAILKKYDGSPQEVIVRNKDTGKQFKLTTITEEALTITIKRVMSSQTKTIYFLQGEGQGELEGDKPQGLYIAKVLLENEGFTVKGINLASVSEVPADAQAIAAWGAQRPYTKSEVDLLSNYIDRGGALIIGQGPIMAATKNKVLGSGLEPLLEKVGLEFKPSVLLEYQIQLLRGKVINVKLPITNFEKHPIVSNLGGQGVMEVLFAQPVIQIPTFKNDKVTRNALASTTENSWAESDISSVLISQKPSPQGDQKGPLPIGQVAEIQVSDQIKDRISPKGTVIAFGDSSFGSNQSIQSGFNRDVFLNAFNFVSGEDISLSIRPKTWTQSTLQISESQQSAVNFAGIFLLPQLILVLAAIVWITRRAY